MENYGLLCTVFILINISANELPSSWQSKLRIVLSFALVTAWSSMCWSEGELTRTHVRKPPGKRHTDKEVHGYGEDYCADWLIA